MPNSVIITRGTKDYQIFQQKNGVASIAIEGTYAITENPKDKVWVRLVHEFTQTVVTNWKAAQCSEGCHFTSTLKDIPAGGLYRIETCLCPSISDAEWGARGDFVFHIGVGDLYVIAGQSNSAGYGKTPINDPPEIGIHLYKNSEIWDLATHPMNDSTRSVHEVNAEGANSGHSPYLSFAKRLKSTLNYPIGLIQTSLGGSPLSAWNPGEAGHLYNNMVDVVKNCTNGKSEVAGILWYQGCSDCSEKDSQSYLKRFKNMVQSIREDFHDKNLPMYTVQLNKVVGEPNPEADYGWAILRESQRVAAKEIRNVYVTPSMDLGLCDLVHNNSQSNMVLGERLANMALSETFKMNVLGKAPDILSAKEVTPTTVRIAFSNISQNIATLGLPAKDLQFEITDDHGVVEIINYVVNIDIIDLNVSREIVGNGRISFAAKAYPHSIIPFDLGSGLPLLGFLNFRIER